MRAGWTHCVGEPGAEQASVKLFAGPRDNLQGDCGPCLDSLIVNYLMVSFEIFLLSLTESELRH